MKSDNADYLETESFWHWFEDVANDLALNLENPAIVRELDRRVRGLHPELSWEIGPGLERACQLVISPNLNPGLRTTAREIVARAPDISSWEFHPARQAKDWDYVLEFRTDSGAGIRIDSSAWTFVLLKYPNRSHEVLLKGDNLSGLGVDERWQAAALTLESIVGEDAVIDRIDSFELVDSLEPRFAVKARPIQELRAALAVP